MSVPSGFVGSGRSPAFSAGGSVVVVELGADEAEDADAPGFEESEHAAMAHPAVAVAPMRKLRRESVTLLVYYAAWIDRPPRASRRSPPTSRTKIRRRSSPPRGCPPRTSSARSSAIL